MSYCFKIYLLSIIVYRVLSSSIPIKIIGLLLRYYNLLLDSMMWKVLFFFPTKSPHFPKQTSKKKAITQCLQWTFLLPFLYKQFARAFSFPLHKSEESIRCWPKCCDKVGESMCFWFRYVFNLERDIFWYFLWQSCVSYIVYQFYSLSCNVWIICLLVLLVLLKVKKAN